MSTITGRVQSFRNQRRGKIPLKLGLILASYPDVLPISLSRKSDGDMGTCRDLAALSSSLHWPALLKELNREHGNTALVSHFLFPARLQRLWLERWSLTGFIRLHLMWKEHLRLKKTHTQKHTHTHVHTHRSVYAIWPVLVFSGSPTFALAFGRIQHLTQQEDTQISENRKALFTRALISHLSSSKHVLTLVEAS